MDKYYVTEQLFEALEDKNIARMSLLLQFAHADVNVVVNNQTLLYKLVSSVYDAVEWLRMFTLLLQHGADPFWVRPFDEVTLIWRAAETGNVVALKQLWQLTPQDQLDKFTIRRSTGSSALRVASQNGFVDAVVFLLEKKMDPNNTTRDGVTPLMSAANNPYKILNKVDEFYEICRVLLRAGANPFSEYDEKNVFGFVDAGNNRVVELFEKEEFLLQSFKILIRRGDYDTVAEFANDLNHSWVSHPKLWVPEVVKNPNADLFFKEIAGVMMEAAVNGNFTSDCHLAQFVPLFPCENYFLQRLKQAHMAQYAVFSAFCNESCDEETSGNVEYEGPILEGIVDSCVYPEQRQRECVKKVFEFYF